MTRKGKRDGIIVPEQSSRPLRIPSAEGRGNFSNKNTENIQRSEYKIILMFLSDKSFFKAITYSNI